MYKERMRECEVFITKVNGSEASISEFFGCIEVISGLFEFSVSEDMDSNYIAFTSELRVLHLARENRRSGLGRLYN